jgi:hypothetical protein
MVATKVVTSGSYCSKSHILSIFNALFLNYKDLVAIPKKRTFSDKQPGPARLKIITAS